MKPIVFLNSHPIQYFAPLYKQITQESNIHLSVWYCSDESIKGKIDKGFGKEVKWDIPMLDGYKFYFLKNNSLKPSIHSGFWGLMNFEVIKKLYHQPKSVVIIHGWSYFTHIVAIVFAKLFGHKVCLRAETPQNQEQLKSKKLLFLKKIVLKCLFLFIDEFLYIGKQNYLFYKSFAINEKKLLPVFYCVDNDRFRDVFSNYSRSSARAKLGLHIEKKIILFSGKYTEKKRPLDLLKAFSKIKNDNVVLVMVGEGELRHEMERLIKEEKIIDNVILTGFINQSLIPFYYRSADLFVMSSGMGETWGLSVNEAMNFGLPIIVSDLCGCAIDLIEHERNGAIYPVGNIAKLSFYLDKFISLEEDELNEIELTNFKKLDLYSYHQIINQLQIIIK